MKNKLLLNELEIKLVYHQRCIKSISETISLLKQNEEFKSPDLDAESFFDYLSVRCLNVINCNVSSLFDKKYTCLKHPNSSDYDRVLKNTSLRMLSYIDQSMWFKMRNAGRKTLLELQDVCEKYGIPQLNKVKL